MRVSDIQDLKTKEERLKVIMDLHLTGQISSDVYKALMFRFT